MLMKQDDNYKVAKSQSKPLINRYFHAKDKAIPKISIS